MKEKSSKVFHKSWFFILNRFFICICDVYIFCTFVSFSLVALSSLNFISSEIQTNYFLWFTWDLWWCALCTFCLHLSYWVIHTVRGKIQFVSWSSSANAKNIRLFSLGRKKHYIWRSLYFVFLFANFPRQIFGLFSFSFYFVLNEWLPNIAHQNEIKWKMKEKKFNGSAVQDLHWMICKWSRICNWFRSISVILFVNRGWNVSWIIAYIIPFGIVL